MTTGPITVTVAGSSVSSVADFTVVGPGPYITTYSPKYGAEGNSVILYGVHFLDVSSVTFNGVSAAFTPNGDGTQITAYVPPGASSGLIRVSGPSGAATPVWFTVVGAGPYIDSFSPLNGNVGTPVSDRRFAFHRRHQRDFQWHPWHRLLC